ncbi:hypothetical protein DL96DRAFT_1818801 [Flagelloscypha sp. PMI_526]|nr:hypothetical protein DL96DRAFT_1818801 [Flagelloscypha sp. PMI_526]
MPKASPSKVGSLSSRILPERVALYISQVSHSGLALPRPDVNLPRLARFVHQVASNTFNEDLVLPALKTLCEVLRRPQVVFRLQPTSSRDYRILATAILIIYSSLSEPSRPTNAIQLYRTLVGSSQADFTSALKLKLFTTGINLPPENTTYEVLFGNLMKDVSYAAKNHPHLSLILGHPDLALSTHLLVLLSFTVFRLQPSPSLHSFLFAALLLVGELKTGVPVDPVTLRGLQRTLRCEDLMVHTEAIRRAANVFLRQKGHSVTTTTKSPTPIRKNANLQRVFNWFQQRLDHANSSPPVLDLIGFDVPWRTDGMFPVLSLPNYATTLPALGQITQEPTLVKSKTAHPATTPVKHREKENETPALSPIDLELADALVILKNSPLKVIPKPPAKLTTPPRTERGQKENRGIGEMYLADALVMLKYSPPKFGWNTRNNL